MVRVKPGKETRRRHKKYLKLAKGNYGAKSRLYRQSREAVEKGLQYAYRDRRQKKREFRSLWINRIGALSRIEGVSYSRLVAGLKKANILINRKYLSELAVSDPEAFRSIVQLAGN